MKSIEIPYDQGHTEWLAKYKAQQSDMCTKLKEREEKKKDLKRQLDRIEKDEIAMYTEYRKNREQFYQVLRSGTFEDFKSLVEGIKTSGTCPHFSEKSTNHYNFKLWSEAFFNHMGMDFEKFARLFVELGVRTVSHDDYDCTPKTDPFTHDSFVITLLDLKVITLDRWVQTRTEKTKKYGAQLPLLYSLLLDRREVVLYGVFRDSDLVVPDPGISFAGKTLKAADFAKESGIYNEYKNWFLRQKKLSAKQ